MISNRKISSGNLLLLVSVVGLYALIAALYFILRYGAQWADSDTASLTKAAMAILNDGRLAVSNAAYRSGYAYQSIVVYLSALTGLSILQLQLIALPLIAAGLSIPAFIMYRELTGNALAAAIAALLLFMQPDFLFVIFRGSHEKVTWLAVILAVWMLARSFNPGQRLSRVFIQAGLFYLFVLLLISANAYMGSAFIIAVEVSLVAGYCVLWLLKRRGGVSSTLAIPRLVYVLGLALLIWFIVIFYIYPPAADLLNTLQTVSGKSIAVGLGQETGANPYASLQTGWINRFAYLGVAMPTFLLGAISFFIWCRIGLKFLRGKTPFEHPQNLLLWLLYAGFGVQLAISIIVDRLGSVSGNFQLRIFPPLLLFAAPLVSLAIIDPGYRRLLTSRNPGRISARLAAIGLTIFLLWSSFASLLKSTNDPWLSNYWIFWTKPERTAIQWIEQYMHDDHVWMDQLGIRLSAHAINMSFGKGSGNSSYSGSLQTILNSYLISNSTQNLSTRLPGIPLPDTRQVNQVYDNGTVQIFRRRSNSPFQR